MSFRNIRDEGVQKVATAADRLALLPTDGTIVEQLDTHTLYIYNQATNTWAAVGGGGGGNAFGIMQTPFGTSPVADAPSDTLTFTSSDGSVIITGDALTDSINLTVASGAGAVSSVTNTDGTLNISPTTGAVVVNMAASGATAGTYPILKATIDSAGRVTAASDNTILTIINALVFG